MGYNADKTYANELLEDLATIKALGICNWPEPEPLLTTRGGRGAVIKRERGEPAIPGGAAAEHLLGRG
jgi:hypothetical protein